MFDVIDFDFFKEKNSLDIFNFLNIDTLYICKEIKTKEDFLFSLPEIKGVVLKKAYLLTDLKYIKHIDNNALFLFKGGTIKNNSLVLSSKQNIHLFNPVGEELCFDEGFCEIAKQNNKLIFFDINEIKRNQYKAIKQLSFIIPLLLSKNIEMRFVSFAKTKDMLFDFKILECFLKNFNIPSQTSKRFFKSVEI